MSTDYGAWPLASLRRDWRRITASIGTLRGGWRATWRHAREFAASRRIVVHSLSPSDGGPQLVLRTRVRLNGDVQTDVLAQITSCQLLRQTDTTHEAPDRGRIESGSSC